MQIRFFFQIKLICFHFKTKFFRWSKLKNLIIAKNRRTSVFHNILICGSIISNACFRAIRCDSTEFPTIFLNRKNEVSQTCASLLCLRTIESKAKNHTLMTDENDSARTMAQAKEILFNSFVRSFISFWLNSWFFSTQRESCRIELHSCSQYSFIFFCISTLSTFEHMKWKKKVMIKQMFECTCLLTIVLSMAALIW